MSTSDTTERPLWEPPAELVERATMTAFLRAQEERLGRPLDGYHDLWRWSVEDLEGFWRAIWDFFEVEADGSPETVLASRDMPGARWFPDVALSYPEHVFRGKDDAEVAIRHASELRELS